MVEPCYEVTTPRRIASKTGAKLLEIPESVGGEKQVTDYFTLFDYDIDLLIRAFR
jgi:zinc/manganese transport system substrate-binding protein